MGKNGSFQLAIEAPIPSTIRKSLSEKFSRSQTVRYEIEIYLDDETNVIGLKHEALWALYEESQPVERTSHIFPASSLPPRSIFLRPNKKRRLLISNKPGQNANYIPDGKSTYQPSFRLGRETAAMANIPADHESFKLAPWFRDLLADGVQTLTLNSQVIRQPSPPGLGKRFQPNGSNLPWVVAELHENKDQFGGWLEHVQTALPDITHIESIERPEDRHRYLSLTYAGGAKVPSWLVSDGTLRLLALTIPAYLPDFTGVILVEEPENGIHPRAIQTVLDSLSSIYNGQVLLATHSPVAINMLEPKDVLCFAKDINGATDIVSGNHHPALQEWKKGEPDFGVLFAAGILS